MYSAHLDSPFGSILLRGGPSGLAGLYFIDQKDCPPLPDAPSARSESQRPGSGEVNGIALKGLLPVRRPGTHGPPDKQLALFPSTRKGAWSHGQAGLTISGSRADPRVQQPGSSTGAAWEVKPSPPEPLQDSTPPEVWNLFERVQLELREYFNGSRKHFGFPLNMAGTPFQLKVWQALTEVPYGELATYGQLAAMAGLGHGHGRAVGSAVGKNPISIVVPCHRIIGSNRTLTGYTGGLSRKVALLQLEGYEFNGL